MSWWERLLGVRVVRATNVALVFEQVHLHRFLEHFRIDCLFDIGANKGQHATMLREQAGYRGTIVSVEPVPKFAEIVERKARADGNWYVENCAIDATAGERTLYVMKHDGFTSLHRPTHDEVDLFVDSNKVAEEIKVPTVPLRTIYDKYKAKLGFTRPFLKMDTQGHDLPIARGAGDLLDEFVGLQSELSVKRLYEDTSEYAAVLDYYRSRGFELSAFVPNNIGHFPRLVEIDCIMYNPRFAAS